MYGQVKAPSVKKSTSSAPVVAPKPGYDNASNHSINQGLEGGPVAPLRRKTSRSSNDSHHYDVPKSSGMKLIFVPAIQKYGIRSSNSVYLLTSSSEGQLGGSNRIFTTTLLTGI